MKLIPSLLVLLLLVGGCAHYPRNTRLTSTDMPGGYRFRHVTSPTNSPELLLMLAFSGSGTRAAALSYGVLEELARTPVGPEGAQHRMLDEVDILSSVSGGSFTAACYALWGDRIFIDFEPHFLKNDVQTDLLLRVLAPWNMVRLASPKFGRSDLAAEHYDRLLFKGATFADLMARTGRPFLSINATDIASGARFEFTQDEFDLVQSGLSQFPVSRTVAASSAFPVPVRANRHPNRPLPPRSDQQTIVSNFKRIAINTGGGDASGLNAVVHAAHNYGWEIHGIRDGFDGLLEPQNYPDGGVLKLTRPHVRDIAHRGVTIPGTSNHGNLFKVRVPQPDGSFNETDRSDDVVRRFRERRLDALISVGGDGTLGIARDLHKKGLPIIGVPKTIDNDLDATFTTFGFDSAVSFATECIDRLHSTAESHRRVIVVEVMGRYAGWLALHAGIAGRADAILIPEIPYDIDKVADHVKRRTAGRNHQYSIVVVAEGERPVGGEVTLKETANAAHIERPADGTGRVAGPDLRRSGSARVGRRS